MVAPLPEREQERLAALLEYSLLDTPPEKQFDDLVRLAAFVCNTPGAAVSLIDDRRQWFKSTLGIEIGEVPRDLSICAHTILQPDVFIIQDTQTDPRFADNPIVVNNPNTRFYAGVPLLSESGFAVGSLCVIDRIPRSLTEDQKKSLQTLARQVMAQMELTRRVAGQAQLIAGRERAEEALREGSRALQGSAARLNEAQRIGGIGDWEIDIATLQVTWSAEVYRLLEFDPTEGEPPFEMVQSRYAPEDRIERNRLFTQALIDGKPYQCDLCLRLPSFTPRWCQLVGVPETDASGKIVRVRGTLLDITERMQREQEITETNLILKVQTAQLEAANAELQSLTTTDPLTGLLNHRTFQTRLAEETARVQRQGTALAVVMLDLDKFQFFNDAYGHILGDAVLRQVAERLVQVCRPFDTVARFGGDEFALILPGVGPASEFEIAARLRADLAGLVFHPTREEAIPINVSLGVGLFTDMSTDRQEALHQADIRLMRSKTGGDSETEADQVRSRMGHSLEGFSMLDALVTAVDNKDRYTRHHSEDVMEYSLMIARELGLDDAMLSTIAVTALLHDLGKIGVPDAILRKPGKLTDEEFGAIKQHPQMGAIMVQAVPGLEDTLDAVRFHHERWDGDGYPFGLKGEETPLMARLMAVADAFSAMTTDRPYRQGMDREKALSILESGAGTQWDPQCVAAFLKAQKSVWSKTE